MSNPGTLAESPDFHFDPNAAGLDVDPLSVYAYMREHIPVYWWEEWKGWIVTKYEDVVMPAKYYRRFSVEFEYSGPAELPVEKLNAHQLLTRYGMFWMHDARHNRARVTVAPLFRPKALRNTEGRSEFDIVEDFVLGYPAQAIAAVLGIPRESCEDFLRFASSILDAFYPVIDVAVYDEKMSYLPQGIRVVSKPTRNLVSFTLYNLLRHSDSSPPRTGSTSAGINAAVCAGLPACTAV